MQGAGAWRRGGAIRRFGGSYYSGTRQPSAPAAEGQSHDDRLKRRLQPHDSIPRSSRQIRRRGSFRARSKHPRFSVRFPSENEKNPFTLTLRPRSTLRARKCPGLSQGAGKRRKLARQGRPLTFARRKRRAEGINRCVRGSIARTASSLVVPRPGCRSLAPGASCRSVDRAESGPPCRSPGDTCGRIDTRR